MHPSVTINSDKHHFVLLPSNCHSSPLLSHRPSAETNPSQVSPDHTSQPIRTLLRAQSSLSCNYCLLTLPILTRTNPTHRAFPSRIITFSRCVRTFPSLAAPHRTAARTRPDDPTSTASDQRKRDLQAVPGVRGLHGRAFQLVE